MACTITADGRGTMQAAFPLEAHNVISRCVKMHIATMGSLRLYEQYSHAVHKLDTPSLELTKIIVIFYSASA